MARLTDRPVEKSTSRRLREMLENSDVSARALAKRLGVARATLVAAAAGLPLQRHVAEGLERAIAGGTV
jgi:hypothetical protein